MNKKTKNSIYESPQVRVRALSLERGFATSPGYGEVGEAGKVIVTDSSDNYGDF